MKGNNLVLVCVLIFSLSIIFGSVWIGNSLRSANEGNNINQSALSLPSNKALMTQKETAQYLSLPEDKFNALLSSDELQRKGLSSYETYNFIPFVKVGGARYFQKEQVDKWVEYSVMRWKEK